MSATRNDLIRAHFEAMRDITWVQTLEPDFTAQGVDAAGMKDLRELWNQHSEERDWPWWQQAAKAHSNAELHTMLADCIEKLNALGMWQWRHEQSRSDRERFEQMIHCPTATNDSMPETGNVPDKDMQM